MRKLVLSTPAILALLTAAVGAGDSQAQDIPAGKPDGEVYIRAKDSAYATPGPDEVQKFAN